MSSKKSNVLYWTFTLLFGVLIILDGIGGLVYGEEGDRLMKTLGYPPYLLKVIGVSKILAGIAIIQQRFPAIREWAFAGLVINLVCAFIARIMSHSPAFETIFPLLLLAFLFVPYLLWKRRQAVYSA